ncbi:MAG TPA: ribulose-phosphate 3-epimerase [Dehalococcoidales bacterium]|nr:ribulose-phosphate 3-epimerase [Dehalococcoidales bacterium]
MTEFTRVVPAILTDDPKALETMVRQAESFTDYVQFDIMDGQFVPSRSITWEHLASLNTKLGWEAHLMVLHPEDYLPGFHQAGAQKIVFHYEATSSPREIISQIRDLGMKAGLAINPDTTVPTILPLLDEVDSVLLLTVNPGFYGSKFIPEVMDKVPELRSARAEIEIGVDGGIKEGNIARIARGGVDFICVGSAIFLQSPPGESFLHLQTLARES